MVIIQIQGRLLFLPAGGSHRLIIADRQHAIHLRNTTTLWWNSYMTNKQCVEWKKYFKPFLTAYSPVSVWKKQNRCHLLSSVCHCLRRAPLLSHPVGVHIHPPLRGAFTWLLEMSPFSQACWWLCPAEGSLTPKKAAQCCILTPIWAVAGRLSLKKKKNNAVNMNWLTGHAEIRGALRAIH